MKFSIFTRFKKSGRKDAFDPKNYKNTKKVERDWSLLLSLFFIVTVLVFVLGYKEYTALILRGNGAGGEEKNGIIDENELKRVITIINKREEVFQKYQATTTSLIDPSL